MLFCNLGEAIKCYKCSSYSDINCAHDETLKTSSMANTVNCDEARRPSYALSGPLVTKCASMTIKGRNCFAFEKMMSSLASLYTSNQA